MSRMRLISGILVLAASVLSAQALRADVTMKQTTVIKGLPMVGDVTTHSTVQVSGDRQRQETRTDMSGMLGRMMAGGNQEAVQIVRLDKDLTWSLNPKEKTYTEMTFQQMRDLMKSMGMELEDGMDELEADGGDVDMKIDVRKTGKRKKVAGIDTEEVVITADGEAEDEETGEVVRSRWIMNLWMAGDEKGLKELEEFNKAMAGKMGFDAGSADQLSTLLSAYADGLKALTKEMEGVGGIPLETHMQIEVEGEEPEGGDGIGIDLGNQGGVAGAIGKRMLGAKKPEREPKAEKPRASAEGFRIVMQSTTVVTEVSTGGLAAGVFEVPEGYRRVDAPSPN